MTSRLILHEMRNVSDTSCIQNHNYILHVKCILSEHPALYTTMTYNPAQPGSPEHKMANCVLGNLANMQIVVTSGKVI